jgi:signal transduction histidine kinase
MPADGSDAPLRLKMDSAQRRGEVRKLFWTAWGSAFAGNAVAAITYGTILAVSVRTYNPDFPYDRLMRQFVLAGVAVVPPTIFGTLVAAKWLIRRRVEWFIEARLPTDAELRRFAALPRLVATANLVAWVLIFVGQITYFIHVVGLPFGSWQLAKTATVYAYGYIVATALAYLFMERRFRPFHEALLPADIEAWPRSMGIERRLLAAWLAVAGAPLLVIAFNWVALTPAQRDASASSVRITALIAGAVGLLIFMIAGRTITGPLRRLQLAQRRVAAGDLSVHVQVEQPGEIGELESGFNRMVEGLTALQSDNAQLHSQLRAQLDEVSESRIRIVEAADAERVRIERNLHDGAQQRLLSLAFGLREVERMLNADAPPLARERVRSAVEELDTAMSELRELARGIHPAILDEEGLGAALSSLAERAPLPTTVSVPLDGRLPAAVEVTAYFIASEALANIAKYADASRATLEATVDNGSLRLEVTDDGRGGADPQRGSGIRGLTDRVAALGGKLAVESEPGNGTRVVAVIPCT